MTTIKIPIRAKAETFVLIELPPGETAMPDDIEKAIAKTCSSGEWDLSDIVPGKPETASEFEATEMQVFHPERFKPSIADRAAEIGVSRQCLTGWRREGIDIHSDFAIRQKIASCPRYLPKVNPHFKHSLEI